MKSILWIILFIPFSVFCQNKLIGKFVAEGHTYRPFLDFQEDYSFTYPSDFPNYEIVSKGNYSRNKDTVFLFYPKYRLDTIVGFNKGLFIGLGEDITLPVRTDTMFLRKNEFKISLKRRNKNVKPFI